MHLKSNFPVQTAKVTSAQRRWHILPWEEHIWRYVSCTSVLILLYFFLISFASEDDWLTTGVSEGSLSSLQDTTMCCLFTVGGVMGV